jgi:TM2 domain-containing membrane protein YozV
MDPYEWQILNALTPEQRICFQLEYSTAKKDPTTALLLALFLGGLGAHQFYMGNVALGIIYAVFCWTLIPACIALVECFLMSGRVRSFNALKAHEIALRTQLLYPSRSTAALS